VLIEGRERIDAMEKKEKDGVTSEKQEKKKPKK